MRILLLAPHPFFESRGTPIAVKALLDELSDRGSHVDVLTYHEGEDDCPPGCKIIRIPRLPGVRGVRPGFSVKKLICDGVLLVRAWAVVRRGSYDLVHAVEESVFMALLLKRFFRVPYVYDMDSSLAHQMIERFPYLRSIRGLLAASEKQAVKGSLATLVMCKALEDRALECAPEKNVVRVEDPSLLVSGGPAVENLANSLSTQGPIVMYVGNLEPYQGIDLLLEGFAGARRICPEAELVIIGGQEEDIGKYKKMAKHLGIQKNAHIIGPRPIATLGGYLAQAEILVSPRTRGFNTPMKVYTYLDSGVAVLATRLPTHTQVLDDEISMLCDPTAAAFGEALVTLLKDDELRQTLGERARKRVEEQFSKKAFSLKIQEFFGWVEDEVLRQDHKVVASDKKAVTRS